MRIVVVSINGDQFMCQVPGHLSGLRYSKGVRSIVVQKYGGSSVATPNKIAKVAQRIAETKAEGHEVVVVVSAMGSATDDLLAQASQITKAPSRRELDMLLTCGERVSMALLSMAVNECGLEAISFTGSQAGVMTNDRHSGARIIEVRPVRVQDELSRGRVVIVAGFQGVSYKREITTLGRGGSDTTAVALAAALGAAYCEICSDVDGIYTGDPRQINAAQLIETIGHEEMIDAALHGARVLHADAVEFARQSQIALYARATAGDGSGTRIDNVREAPGFVVSTLTPIVRLTAAPSQMTPTLARLKADAIDVFASTCAGETMQVYLNLSETPNHKTAIDTLAALTDVAMSQVMTAVTATKFAVGKDPAALHELSAIAREADATWSTPRTFTAMVTPAAADKLAQELHDFLATPVRDNL